MSSYEPPSAQTLDWVAKGCGPGTSIESIERLFGGLTADMDRILLRDSSGDLRRVVLRRWSPSWRDTGDLVVREAAAFEALTGHDIPAPQLIAMDPTGDSAGVHCVLMTELPGNVELAPTDLPRWLKSLAHQEARIHQVAPGPLVEDWGWFDPERGYAWIEDIGLRRDALAAATPSNEAGPAVFRHGDFQHFNILWTDGAISGVVDWPMAGIGPRGLDVGHCRLNLAVLFSADAAADYLDLYEASAGVAVDPATELQALLNWSPTWMDFIPIQINGRATVDLKGMRDRVVETIRRTLRPAT